MRSYCAKHYELENHLGNVLATVSDKRDIVVDGSNNVLNYTAKVDNVSFYYPFGSLMPGISDFGGGHRFGFQGQQKDNEVRNVNGSHIDFKYRPYNSDLCRFWKVDPLTSKYPWNSPFAFSENKVVNAVELEGLESRYFYSWTDQTTGECKSMIVNWKDIGNNRNYAGPKGIGTENFYIDDKGKEHYQGYTEDLTYYARFVRDNDMTGNEGLSYYQKALEAIIDKIWFTPLGGLLGAGSDAIKSGQELADGEMTNKDMAKAGVRFTANALSV